MISDIDGVLLLDGRIMPGTATLAGLKPFALVSNNSTHSSENLCLQFRAAGVDLEPEQFFLAGEAAVRRLAGDMPGARISFLGTAAIRDLLERHGLVPLDAHQWRRAEAVLVCRDTSLCYARLEAAASAAAMGIPVYCANSDGAHPARHGVHIETGAILAALSAAVPAMRPVVVGKPGPALLREAVTFLQVCPEQAVFLGDNLLTDEPCASSAGIPFICVDAVRGPSLEQLL